MVTVANPPETKRQKRLQPRKAAWPNVELWPEIIRTVTTPLGFFTLIVLVLAGVLMAVLGVGSVVGNIDATLAMVISVGTLGLLASLIGIVGFSSLTKRNIGAAPGSDPSIDDSQGDLTPADLVAKKHDDILHFHEGLAEPDVWDRELRPVLHQATLYSVPTYYMDTELNVLDWNVAFAIIFKPILGKLRNRHVNYFIVRLDNRDEVYDRARDFTRKVQQGRLPLVHTETLQYTSEDFHKIRFLKVAVQLHDVEGKHRGWAVSLLPQEIDWPAFQEQLELRISDDKLWSVYSAPYDRVLTEFPPYQQLISDVISVIPAQSRRVADLGAGTGNVTRALLAAKHRVTAVESNQGMIDKFRAKRFDASQVSIVKASVEHLDMLQAESHDAAVMVNVLYAVNDPVACLQNVYKILKPGGVLGLSTTHRETNLSALLESIKTHLQDTGQYKRLAADYQAIVEANRHIELTIAKKWSREQYKEWLEQAGFEITKEIESTYEGAVLVLHARKPKG